MNEIPYLDISQCAKCSTLEEWLQLPELESHKFKWYLPFLIYREPYAMEWDEWKKFHAYIKREYPVQFFFRYTLNIFLHKIEYRLGTFWWNVRGRLSNPRKEMRNAVFPPNYQDLPITIMNLHFEVIVEFVEREGFLKGEAAKLNKKFSKELNKYYNYVKTERAVLLEKASAGKSVNYIKNINKIAQKDEELAFWVIKNRELFWI